MHKYTERGARQVCRAACVHCAAARSLSQTALRQRSAHCKHNSCHPCHARPSNGSGPVTLTLSLLSTQGCRDGSRPCRGPQQVLGWCAKSKTVPSRQACRVCLHSCALTLKPVFTGAVLGKVHLRLSISLPCCNFSLPVLGPHMRCAQPAWPRCRCWQSLLARQQSR